MLEHREIRKQNNKSGKPVKKHLILEIKDYLELKYEFRRNVLALEIEYRSVDEKHFKVLDEAKINSIWIDLQLNGFKISDALLIKILNSDLFSEHHPIIDYIKQLPVHDGKDYIKELAGTIKIADVGVDDIRLQDLWLPYLKKWLVASVATAIGKGTNHLCLILVGGQGIGKTTWLNRLCPESMQEFLICSHINPSLTDQNTANFLAEKWFVNIDDQLETIFGKDFNSMKAIITAPFVTNRKAWHRLTRKRRRVCNFMGSVNNPRFLSDIENRRYLVFTAENFNLEDRVDMDKVWAQALNLLDGGYPYWFSKDEMQQLNKINDLYRQVAPEEEWLIKLYEPCMPTDPNAKFLMPSEILAKINNWSGMRLSIRKLSQAIEKLGFSKKVSKRINGQPRNVYPVIERTDSDETKFQEDIRTSLD